MTTIVLSKQSEVVVEHAYQFAQQKQHDSLDGPHLFHAILCHTDEGRDWLHSVSLGSDLITALEAAFDRWYDAGEAEPSAAYIRIMRAAEENAAASGLYQITPGHLLKAVLSTDELLQDWLRSQGIAAEAAAATPTPRREPGCPSWFRGASVSACTTHVGQMVRGG